MQTADQWSPNLRHMCISPTERLVKGHGGQNAKITFGSTTVAQVIAAAHRDLCVHRSTNKPRWYTKNQVSVTYITAENAKNDLKVGVKLIDIFKPAERNHGRRQQQARGGSCLLLDFAK